jgi:hypothetical protein
MLFLPSGILHRTQTFHRLSIGAMILLTIGVTTAWVVLYQLNSWLFSDLQLNKYINWIFLPAAIRVLAVMINGWAGVLGLFFGAILTNLGQLEFEPLNVLMLAGLSALGPIAAVHLCTRWLQLPVDLFGLQRSQLLVFAVAGALFNVIPHNLFFYMSGISGDAWSGVLPMFVGDLAGTLIVLYVASFSMRMATKGKRA